MIHLQTRRMIIRDQLPEDLPSRHELISDKEVMYYLQGIMADSIERTHKAHQALIDEIGKPDRRHYFFRMEGKQTCAHIGEIGYAVNEFTPMGKLVGAGYHIRREFWGKGYTTEAFREVIRHAFEQNDIWRISSGCLKENAASERVMIKCGMIKEAHFKDHSWHDGKLKDRVEYRLLKCEWAALRQTNNDSFWQALDKLVAESEIIIDRAKGSTHPRYPNLIYPLDYGYLKNTASPDGAEIDIWRGSDPAGKIDAIMCIVDLCKRESEIKILIGCTEEEKLSVYRFHNETQLMKGILIRRE